MGAQGSRCLADGAPDKMALQSLLLIEQQQQQQALSVPESEANTPLASRLSLTGRYFPGKPFTKLQEQCTRFQEGMRYFEISTASQEPPDFRVTPPSSALIEATLQLIGALDLKQHNSDKLANSTQPIAADLIVANTPLASLVLLALKQEIFCTDLQVPVWSRVRRAENAWRLKQMQQLCARLTQGSFHSVLARQTACTAREQNMHILAQAHGGRDGLARRHAAWDAIERNTSDLLKSSNFAVMRFGSETTISEDDQGMSDWEQDNGTAKLLQIRIMLRSEPFFVLCSGASHMGAFFQLAKLSELYLQLLPTASHKDRVVE